MSTNVQVSADTLKISITREREDYNHLTIRVQGKGFFGEACESLFIITAKNMEVNDEDWQGSKTGIPVFDIGASKDVEGSVPEAEQKHRQYSEEA